MSAPGVKLVTDTRGRTTPSHRDLMAAYNLEAETGLVGHLLLHGPSPEIRTLQPEAFHRPAHKITAAIIYDLADEGRPTDAVTVHDETTRRALPGLDLPELIAAVAGASLPASAVAHAQIVADWSAARAVMGIAAELDLAAATGHIDEAAQHASEQLLALGQHAGTPGHLLIEDIAVVAARADAANDVRWLARPIWPGDAYGMLAAGWKVGKTWFMWDLAVSVASGGAWLGAYPVETQGPVLMFLGEGGERKMTRRGRAVAEARGVKLEDLPIRVCHRAHNLLGAIGLASGGFVTRGPTAIVGEGNPAHPEFVVPTDPAYRSRALGLYASLGTHLMADGGQLGGVGLPASASDALRQLVAGQSMGSASGAMRAIDAAITNAVPAGVVRSVMFGAVSTILGALGRGIALGGGIGGVLGAGGSATGNQALGQAMAAALGWTGAEWTALQMLWQRESGWSNTALNPRSGAYGIAQALPATKYPFGGQAAGGSSARAQIEWGLNYIRTRPDYGDPLTAWAHEQAMGWYAKGGVLPTASYDTGGFLPEGLSLAANHTGAPEFVPGPGGASGNLTVQVCIDSKVVGEATVTDFRRRVARR